MNNVALQIATENLARARRELTAHEAVVAMHRDNKDGLATRSAQARVNGLKTKVGKACFSVRQAGGNV